MKLTLGKNTASILKAIGLAKELPKQEVKKAGVIPALSFDPHEARDDADIIAQLAGNAYQAQIHEIWVYACVQAIARAASSVPFKLYRNIPMRDGTVEKEEVEDEDAKAILEQVNHDMSWADFVEGTMAYLELTGNAYWEPVHFDNDSSQPLQEIHLARPDRVRAVPHPKERISGWEFLSADGQWVSLSKETLIQLKYFNPESDLVGLPPFAAALKPTTRDVLAQTWNENFYKHSARPDAVIETDNYMSDVDVKRLRKQWLAWHGGLENSHLPGFLTNGLKYRVVGQIPDMAFQELRKMSRTEILAAFGVPSVLVGVLDDASYANANAQVEQFWRNTMLSKLAKFSQAFNVSIAPRLGADIFGEFDLSEIEALKENANEKSARDVAEVTVGIVTINEVRKGRNLPAVDWGDIWWQPLGVVPAGQSFSASPFTPEIGPGDQFNSDPLFLNPSSDPAVNGTLRAKFMGYTPERREAIQKRFSRDVETQANPATKQIARFLNAYSEREARRFSNVLKQTTNPLALGAIVKGTAEDVADLAEILASFGLRQVRDSGRAASREVGATFTLTPSVEDIVEQMKQESAQKIVLETDNIIRRILQQAAEQDELPTAIDIARAIRESSAFSPARAERIARTEAVQSMNLGLEEGYKQGGVDHVEWVSVINGARESHGRGGLDGQIQPIGTSFNITRGENSGQTIRRPGDPQAPVSEIVNCRCTLAPVIRIERVSPKMRPHLTYSPYEDKANAGRIH